jgi:hypothetical protein
MSEAKIVRIYKRYFQDSHDTSKVYMVCIAMDKKNNYRWEIYSSNDPGTWNEQSHANYWESSLNDALNDGIEVFHNIFKDTFEINYTECNFAMLGNFANSDILKQEILELIQEHKPEILTYFI